MKNEKQLRKILRINGEYGTIQDLLAEAKDAYVNNDEFAYNENLKDALIKSEKSYFDLRRFVADTVEFPFEKKKIFEEEMANDHIGIKLLENGIISISMPIILPFKKIKSVRAYPEKYDRNEKREAIDRVNMLSLLLENALNDFKNKKNFSTISLQNFTIFYKNIFAKDYMKSIPDCDNYEYKQLTDVIVRAFSGGNDSYNNVNFILSSVIGNATRTEIYLIPNNNIFKELDKICCFKSSSKIIKFPEQSTNAA